MTRWWGSVVLIGELLMDNINDDSENFVPTISTTKTNYMIVNKTDERVGK